MTEAEGKARLAVDIGGTFTDLAMERGGRRWSAKVPTTPRAPEQGVATGVAAILDVSGLKPDEVGLIIHGTTLATNAIIERKGATTALLVTDGFRDSIEMAYENRFEQFDLMMDKPAPLVPRHLRLSVPERLDARGHVRRPLDEACVPALVESLRAAGVTSVAIGLLHSYVNPVHERRLRDLVGAAAPDLAITLSSDVAPEIREYERWSTACGNAYVQPIMARYLESLRRDLARSGFGCPILLITSAGGLTSLDLACRFPIRLVESGPAGGAILAADLARLHGYDRLVSFDMGGTTAKLCLIDDGKPHYARSFEVARQYRFLKGSGLPLRIPVIEMVEIGAGGGSIATIDDVGRIQVGPHSAGSEPGPACYGRGGTGATVTDADLLLGRIDPAGFGGGAMALDGDAATRAVDGAIGVPIGIAPRAAALAIAEVVEENMANAARVHAVESGKRLADRTMIAFGGAAPLHAVRLAEKLGIARVLVPTSAGVGSAVGFLRAPIAYEVVRSRYARLDGSFDRAGLAALQDEMRAEAAAVVREAAADAALFESWTADVRYQGQGHDVTIVLDGEDLEALDAERLRALFVARYAALFGRSIPDLGVEVLNWSLRLSTALEPSAPLPPMPPEHRPTPRRQRDMVDPAHGRLVATAEHHRPDLAPGAVVPGPAIIVEDETSTVVLPGFTARINGGRHIVITREGTP